MLKGLVINNPCINNDRLKSALGYMDSKIDITVLYPKNEDIQIIDTRDIDIVFIPHRSISEEEIREYTEPFIEGLIESEHNIIALKIDNTIRYINKRKILFIEVMGRNSCLYTSRHKYMMPRQTLNKVLDEIDDPYIIRCHKSYAVNIREVEEIYKVRRGMWKPVFGEDSGQECLISEKYYKDVLRKLEELACADYKNEF